MNLRDSIRKRIPTVLISDDKIDYFIQETSETYKNEPEKIQKLVYAECLLYILRLPTSISEGGFSISAVDKEHYLKELESIYISLGMYDKLKEIIKKPDITNAGEWY